MLNGYSVRATVEQDSTDLISYLGDQDQGNAETGETKAIAGEALRPSFHDVVHFIRDTVGNR